MLNSWDVASFTPIRRTGELRPAHRPRNRTSSSRGTLTITRPADSENSRVAASRPVSAASSASTMRAPTPNRNTASASAIASPPSLRSWAESMRLSVAAAARSPGEPLLGGQVNSGWHAAEVSVHDTRPRRTVQFGVRLAEQVDITAIILPARWNPAGNIINNPEHGDDGGGVDGELPGLIVEGHIAAGDGDAEFEASRRQTVDRFRELPHHLGVFG